MGRSATAKNSEPRDAATKLAQQRLSVLELTRELGNVAEAFATISSYMASFIGIASIRIPPTSHSASICSSTL